MTSEQSHRSGFTLVEIMAVIVLTTIFVVVSMDLTTNAFRSHRSVEGYTGDLLSCQEALRVFGKDFRAARDVRSEDGDVRVTGRGTEIVYHLDEGRLLRRDGHDVRQLSRSIARVDAAREGALVHLEIELAPRIDPPPANPTVLTSTTRMRSPGEKR